MHTLKDVCMLLTVVFLLLPSHQGLPLPQEPYQEFKSSRAPSSHEELSPQELNREFGRTRLQELSNEMLTPPNEKLTPKDELPKLNQFYEICQQKLGRIEGISGGSYFEGLEQGLKQRIAQIIEQSRNEPLPEHLTWCTCGNGPLVLRLLLIFYEVGNLRHICPQKTDPVVIAAFAEEGLLQPWLLVNALFAIGYTNVTVNAIGPSIEQANIGTFNNIATWRNLMLDTIAPDAQPTLRLRCFKTVGEYVTAVKNGTALKSHSFDLIDCGYEHDFPKPLLTFTYSTKTYIENGTTKQEEQYVTDKLMKKEEFSGEPWVSVEIIQYEKKGNPPYTEGLGTVATINFSPKNSDIELKINEINLTSPKAEGEFEAQTKAKAALTKIRETTRLLSDKFKKELKEDRSEFLTWLQGKDATKKITTLVRAIWDARWPGETFDNIASEITLKLHHSAPQSFDYLIQETRALPNPGIFELNSKDPYGESPSPARLIFFPNGRYDPAVIWGGIKDL